eukprot:1121234-Pyramimonas_sp.AAC.1
MLSAPPCGRPCSCACPRRGRRSTIVSKPCAPPPPAPRPGALSNHGFCCNAPCGAWLRRGRCTRTSRHAWGGVLRLSCRSYHAQDKSSCRAPRSGLNPHSISHSHKPQPQNSNGALGNGPVASGPNL